jgi:hypothetical protein
MRRTVVRSYVIERIRSCARRLTSSIGRRRRLILAKKAAWAFHSVIWKEFQGRRSERKKRREDWAPIWKCIKGRKHALYDKLR